jgi:opacity protein-like surface antigen
MMREHVMDLSGKARIAFALPAFLACFCSPAIAADLPSRKAPVIAPAPPVFTWTGLYIGFNYGYTWAGSSGIATLGAPAFDTTALNLWPGAAAAGAAGYVNGRLNGFFGGAQIGYNWQFADRFVAGLETDLQGAGVRGGGGFGSITPAALPGFSALTSATVNRNLEHFGTVRGRVGYAVTPGILAYVTGGLAYGGASLNAKVNQALNPSLLVTGNASAEKFSERVGWTIGAGGEMALAPNLSAKLEYLYYDLGTVTAGAPNFGPMLQRNPFTGAGVGTAMAASTRFNGHILRTGLNYRFGGQDGQAAGLPSFALVGAERPQFGEWRVSVTPYMWAFGMNGSQIVRGNSLDSNMTFVDALTKTSSFPLEFAANVEVRNGPLSFYSDFVWTQLRFAGSLFALRNPIFGAALALDANARMKMTMAIVEGGATYEMARWGYAGAPAAFTAIDAVAGLRYWRVGMDLALDITGAINLTNLGMSQSGSRAIARSGDMSWVDPFVGLRLRQQVDQANAFYLKADVGGFGAGSKFSWQAAGGYTHDFQFAGINWTGLVGYRALYVDYSRGSGVQQSGLNAILHGPVAGLGVKF